MFFINDLAGQCTDIHDPRRTKQVFTERGISKLQVSYVAIAPLILAYVAFAAVGGPALLLGAAIAILSLLYSWSSSFWQGHSNLSKGRTTESFDKLDKFGAIQEIPDAAS